MLSPCIVGYLWLYHGNAYKLWSFLLINNLSRRFFRRLCKGTFIYYVNDLGDLRTLHAQEKLYKCLKKRKGLKNRFKMLDIINGRDPIRFSKKLKI